MSLVEMPINEHDVRMRALMEHRDDHFRVLVEREKKRLRARKWWHRLFPFTITITRRV